MLILTSRERKVLAVMLIVTVLFAYYKFAEKPGIIHFAALRAKYNDNMRLVNSLVHYQNSIDALKAQVQELEKNTAYLPEGESVSSLLSYFKQFINQSGCTVVKIEFSDTVSDSLDEFNIPKNSTGKSQPGLRLGAASVECSAYGDYKGIIDIVRKVNNIDRGMVIRKISLKKDTSENKYHASLSIYCYYFMSMLKKGVDF